MNKVLYALPIALLGFSSMQTASASAVVTAAWTVTDATNKSLDPHGLWTNGKVLGKTTDYTAKNLIRYSFQSDSQLLEYSDQTAHLTATAKNPFGIEATVDIWFENWSDTYSKVKTGGSSNVSDWDFYASIKKGSTITLNSQVPAKATTYYVGMVNNGSGPVLQIGTGANDKTKDFGASTWLDIYSDEARTQKLFGAKHWDLNMDLEPNPSLVVAPVPVPAAAWLFFSGLIGLVSFNRRKI